MSNTATSLAWPLFFKHHGTLLGKGFLADIEIQGRLLARPEADGVWIDGVNPGAIAFGGATLNETHAGLRDTLARIFVDFAEQTFSFEEFKAMVEHFFNESDEETLREWDAAVAAVRAGMPGPDGVQRKDANAASYIRITQKPVEAVTPKDNTIVQQESEDALYAAYAQAA
jgi:hypothetical protein